MTGFAREEDNIDSAEWVWELRSVNGKGLDVRFRLPSGFEQLEPEARKLFTKHVSRGNIQASLSLKGAGHGQTTKINDATLNLILTSVKAVEDKIVSAPSSAAQILALRGVLEVGETELDDEVKQALHAALLTSLATAIEKLADHRRNEGTALSGFLLNQIDSIEQCASRAEDDPSRSKQAIAERLKNQVTVGLDLADSLDRDRLHQEAALLASKADIREELDRLIAHVAAARDLIAQGSPVGRKLEFLAQEFNRESNTLCSKSNAVSITQIGLDLKFVVDQFREQVLNVE